MGRRRAGLSIWLVPRRVAHAENGLGRVCRRYYVRLLEMGAATAKQIAACVQSECRRTHAAEKEHGRVLEGDIWRAVGERRPWIGGCRARYSWPGLRRRPGDRGARAQIRIVRVEGATGPDWDRCVGLLLGVARAG